MSAIEKLKAALPGCVVYTRNRVFRLGFGADDDLNKMGSPLTRRKKQPQLMACRVVLNATCLAHHTPSAAPH